MSRTPGHRPGAVRRRRHPSRAARNQPRRKTTHTIPPARRLPVPTPHRVR
jgi:hypothetical protein